MSEKFRAYDSKVLTDSYLLAVQFVSKIESIINENDIPVTSLPASVLPTNELYAMCLCYEVMYDTLTKEHLIKDAHIKPTNTVH
jgi:hypothetical protein